jgi:hypothetical protein
MLNPSKTTAQTMATLTAETLYSNVKEYQLGHFIKMVENYNLKGDQLFQSNDPSLNNKTALMITASYYSASCKVEILVNKGGNVNTQTSDGHTALMEAAMKGNSTVVSKLLGLYADPLLVNNNGERASDIASKESLKPDNAMLSDSYKLTIAVLRKAENAATLRAITAASAAEKKAAIEAAALAKAQEVQQKIAAKEAAVLAKVQELQQKIAAKEAAVLKRAQEAQKRKAELDAKTSAAHTLLFLFGNNENQEQDQENTMQGPKRTKFDH